MNNSAFRNMENWYGSFIELAIEYHPMGDDAKLQHAINTIWHQPELTGPWHKREDFGKATHPVEDLEADGFNHLYGLLQLESVNEIGCLTLTVRESEHVGGSDWLCFCIPTGMLELVFEIEYPIFRDANPWLDIVEQFLLKCAIAVHNVSPYDLAIIGEEVSGYVNSKEITAELVTKGGYVLSKRLADTLDVSEKAVDLTNQLMWFPFVESG